MQHLDVCELVSKIVGHNPGQAPANSTAVIPLSLFFLRRFKTVIWILRFRLIVYLFAMDQVWQQLKTVVLATRHHPGLLAWYIADDTVNWPHDGLRTVYRTIKSWDPYHPASIAMAWAGNAINYRDSFDINSK